LTHFARNPCGGRPIFWAKAAAKWAERRRIIRSGPCATPARLALAWALLTRTKKKHLSPRVVPHDDDRTEPAQVEAPTRFRVVAGARRGHFARHRARRNGPRRGQADGRRARGWRSLPAHRAVVRQARSRERDSKIAAPA